MSSEGCSVGDRVRWTNAIAMEYGHPVGIILSIVLANADFPQFTLYEVEFVFGTRSLYGTQIELAKD